MAALRILSWYLLIIFETFDYYDFLSESDFLCFDGIVLNLILVYPNSKF